MRILVVDVDRGRLQTVWSILAALGFKGNAVTALQDPAQALVEIKKSRVKRELFDVVFMYGGEENGFKWDRFLTDLRRTASVDVLPAIVFRPAATRDHVMRAVNLGATGLLCYPCSISDLESVLKLCLKKHKVPTKQLAAGAG